MNGEMLYPYLSFPDGTDVLHTQIMNIGGRKCVEVHFERPTDHGFDTARCRLPDYAWIQREGFAEDEIAFFEQFLISNAHLLYRYAESGGIRIA